MLSHEELGKLFDARKLTENARNIVLNVRESGPSRNARSGSLNVATHYASRKMGMVIKAEARSTELATLYEWDHDKESHEFYDQPPQIKKLHTSEKGREYGTLYTPDFFRIADDFIGWVECKDARWLEKNAALANADYYKDDEGVWRCRSAERYAESVGLDFAVKSSESSDPIFTQNISDLSDYFEANCPTPGPECLEMAQSLMPSGWAWLRDLIDDPARLSADTVYKLIVDEQLHVDLKAVTLMDEPHRVRVFKSKELLASSEIWMSSQLEPKVQGLSTLNIQSGESCMWDGKAFEILNVGDSAVHLRSGDGAPVSIETVAFENLVNSGTIAGTGFSIDLRSKNAGRVLREASPEDMACAMHRYFCLHPERRPEDVAVPKACSRSLRKWLVCERDGEREFGNGFVGLIPKTRLRGNRNRRLTALHLQLINQVVDVEVKNDVAGKRTVAYSLLTSACQKAGLVVPSRKTFNQEILRLSSPVELKTIREGAKAAYNLELPYLSLERTTPRHGCRPWDAAHIDHSQLDLQFVDEKFGRHMKKAWLTVLIDAYTRCILAWVVLFDEPSYRSNMMVIRDCIRRHKRFPKTIVSDQGSDFKSSYFDLLLAMLNSHKRMRPASKPRFGSIIERFFGITNELFIHSLVGNNKALQTPRSMSPNVDPRKHAVWTLTSFREAFERFINEYYHAVEHSALGVSPATAMEIGVKLSGSRPHTRIAYDRTFLIYTMPSTRKGTSLVKPDGSFTANKIRYYSKQLIPFQKQHVEVRYDPFDASRAYFASGSGWIECISLFAGQLKGRSEKEIQVISLELNELNTRNDLRSAERNTILGRLFEEFRDTEKALKHQKQEARDREQKAAYPEDGLLASSNWFGPDDEGSETDDDPLLDGTTPTNLASDGAAFIPKAFGDF